MRWMTGLSSVFATLCLAMAVPTRSFAQLFPVSADVATVRGDLLLWATALIGVVLAIYAFKRVRGLVG